MKRTTKRVKHRKEKVLIILVSILGASGCCYALRRDEPAKPQTTAWREIMTAASELAQELSAPSERTAPTIPTAHTIPNVPHIFQKEKFPTGCESVAAVTLLQFCGADITVEEFIDEYLPIADYPYYDEEGIMHGESPWEYFIGDPYSPSGYGCYAPPIVNAMREAVSDAFIIEQIENATIPSLCETYIANGDPVLIWATMYMLPPENGTVWQLPNGESYQFIRPEHALLLIGYDAAYYYFSDPLSEEAVTAYPKKDCEIAFEALHSQAVTVLKV